MDGCIQIRIYLWVLKLKFYIIFTSQNILHSIFFSHLKNVKIILSLQAIQKQATGWIWS